MTTNAATVPTDLSVHDFRALQDAILTALANEKADIRVAEDIPVIQSLHARMDPDLLVNEKGHILLIHEKPLPDPIWWVEYDPDDRQLIFVTTNGQIMPFGVPIHPTIDIFLRYARVMYLLEIDNTGEMIRIDERPVAVRKNGKD